MMTATLECGGEVINVKLRNLSSDGALIEGQALPIEGTELIFRKGELAMAGRVVWVQDERCGVAFARKLDPDQVLRHVPMPRPRVQPDCRRPGLTSPLSRADQQPPESWLSGPNKLR